MANSNPTPPKAAQEMVSPLCSQGTLLAHVQLGVHHHQALF